MLHELVVNETPSGNIRDFGTRTPPDFSRHPSQVKSKWRWLPVEVVCEPLGEDQIHGPAIKTVETNRVLVTHPMRDLTLEELEDRVRERRRERYMSELGARAGFEQTVGDVLDVVIAELVARGEAATADFAELVAKVAAIKTDLPHR